MTEVKYKIKVRDLPTDEKQTEQLEPTQTYVPQTKEEWMNFLVKNKAYPYKSKKGKIFFRRIKKTLDHDDNFFFVIKDKAIEKLELKSEEDCKSIRENVRKELCKSRVYKPSIKDWPEEERPREMLRKYGSESLSPAKLLAIILRTGDSVKRISAEELARNLIDHFGSFRSLDSTSLSELCSINGIGMAKAAQIKAAFEIGKRMEREKVVKGKKIKSVEDVFNYYKLYLRDLKKEVFKMMILDSRNKLIKDVTISTGSLNASLVHPREVIKEAVKESAAAVLFVHNHPSGDTTPTKDDIDTTKRLVVTCELVGISVLDHVIIGGDDYTSFVDKGLIREN